MRTLPCAEGQDEGGERGLQCGYYTSFIRAMTLTSRRECEGTNHLDVDTWAFETICRRCCQDTSVMALSHGIP